MRGQRRWWWLGAGLVFATAACERRTVVEPDAAVVASLGDTALRDAAPPMIRAGTETEPGTSANILPDTTCPEALQGRVRRCAQWTAGNGHWYAVLDEKLYFEEAGPAAAGLPPLAGASARLASLTSPEELAFVTGTVLANLAQPTPSDAPLDAYWLGATATENAGNDPDAWRWTSGEPWGYTAWAPGEPNNANETALSVWGAFSDRPAGTWNNLLPRNMAGNPLHRIWSLVEWETTSDPNVCEVPVINYKQVDERWAGLRLDSKTSPADTIGTIGCVLTSLAILYSHAGRPADPPTLNSEFIARGAFTAEGNIDYRQATRIGTNRELQFVPLSLVREEFDSTRAKQVAADAVCRGFPVVATVKNISGRRRDHAVVIRRAPRIVTPTTSWREFEIADPGYRNREPNLGVYAAKPIWIRGFVQRTGGGGPAVPDALPPSDAVQASLAATAAQEVELVVGGGTAILTDALGRRLGLLDTADVTLAEIPGGGFDPYIEPGRVGDDVADAESATSVSVSFWLKQESAATYDVRVRATRTGTLTLDFGDDTPRRNVFRWQGVQGAEYRFTILFDPNPATRLIIQRTDAGAPRPYQLTALCGTRFRVRNRSDYQVTATWDVYGTTEAGTLQLPPRPSGQEFSETVFETTARGTVRLFVGGKQVDVKAPSAGACGS